MRQNLFAYLAKRIICFAAVIYNLKSCKIVQRQQKVQTAQNEKTHNIVPQITYKFLIENKQQYFCSMESVL